jgi:single-stranded-DNA-specific exonuclease
LRQQGRQRALPASICSDVSTSSRLATVCDVVPLKGLNRAFVVKGLLAAREHGQSRACGALSQRAGVNGPLTPYHLGFLIGPRINAGGQHW